MPHYGPEILANDPMLVTWERYCQDLETRDVVVAEALTFARRVSAELLKVKAELQVVKLERQYLRDELAAVKGE